MKNCDRRRQSVLNMLRKTKKLTVEEAMQAFGVSESTVRRLFAQLEAMKTAEEITRKLSQRGEDA